MTGSDGGKVKCKFKNRERHRHANRQPLNLPVEGKILMRSSSISKIDVISRSFSSSIVVSLPTLSALRPIKSRMRTSQAL